MNRILIIGYGIQGKKRYKVDRDNVVGIVDPFEKNANYRELSQAPLTLYDIGYVCCPDHLKEEIIRFLVQNKKHVLIEKPLYPVNFDFLSKINRVSKKNKTVIYVAYNHRFEPNILDVKEILKKKMIGDIYYISFFYGNGTAQDILKSNWRNKEKNGIFQDLGCHVLDLINFFDLEMSVKYLKTTLSSSFETISDDYGQLIFDGKIKIVISLSNLSWKNSFFVDCVGQKGSVHASSLCKWGKSKSIFRKRVYPSGVPIENKKNYSINDPTWVRESEYFLSLVNNKKSGVNKKEFKILEILDKINSC